MPRRAQSRSHSPAILLLFLVACGAVGWFLLSAKQPFGKKDEFHGLTDLDLKEFRENSKSLQGNVYQIRGQVEDQLGGSASRGRVLSVSCDGEPVGVHVPPALADQTIAIGQVFLFRVRVGEGGTLVVETLKKA